MREAYGLDIIFRWPDNAEIGPEIEAFEPLERWDAGIAAGAIRLVNGTLLKGVDEVRAMLIYTFMRPLFPSMRCSTGD